MRAFLFLCMLSLSIFAADIKWLKMEDALQIAQKENKVLMVEVSSHACKYCIEMANTTFKNEKIVSKINTQFAPVILHNDSDSVPPKFFSKGTPTFFFVDKNGKKLMSPIFGAWNANDFDFFLETALKKAKE
jgi:thioredoxin-related protein